MRRRVMLLLLGSCLAAYNLSAQLQSYNHPELQWQTIKTEHFYIHYHQGTTRTANLTADIAEYIYQPVVDLYGYTPDTRIHFIIRDHDDISNGAAFYYDNKIELWAPPMDFHLRGTHNWLQNVVTHEFSHMISLGAARKGSRSIPAVYLQWMGYEKEKRPDVIHGYPNTLVSFPLAGTIVPMWFAEGLAQFQRAGFDFERWDSHRDMIMRTAVLADEMLSLNEMSGFGKTSLGNEKVYDHGYAFCLFIAEKYGEKTLASLARAMSRPMRTSFSQAVKEVLDRSGQELYSSWKIWLKQQYQPLVTQMANQGEKGRLLSAKGLAHFYPIYSPDNQKLAYLWSDKASYMSLLSLYVKDLKTGKIRRIKSGVTSAASWSPDGTRLVYAKNNRKDARGSYFYDLYVYDLKAKKETKITRGKRARHPSWSAKGEIVAIVESDGTSNLVLCKADGSNFRQITAFKNGEQIFTPHWTADAQQILFALAEKNHGRDIASVQADGSGFKYVIQTQYDERDPFPMADGSGFVFSSDQSGIFNLYQCKEGGASGAGLTNVRGGAFMPTVDGKGRIVYVEFTASGFKLARLESADKLVEVTPYTSPYADFASQNGPENKLKVTAVPRPSTPYKTKFAKLAFLPRLMMDHPGKLKLGTYFYGSDFLDKISILGGVAANSQFDTDVFGIFQYRQLYPVLFIEAYHQQRHTSNTEADYRFQLFEIDIGADWRLGKTDLLRTAYVFSRYDAKMSFEDQGHKFNLPYTYHYGNSVKLHWTHLAIEPSLQSSIAPAGGRKFDVNFEYARQNFIKGFKLNQNYGTLVEDYENYNYLQMNFDWHEYSPGLFKRHSMAFRMKAGLISRKADSFYNLFAGGLDGLKGYPYYSIEGRRLLQLEFAYRLPLVKFKATRVGIFNLRDLYLSLHCAAGSAWTGSSLQSAEIKKDAGAQLRLSMFSFYGYPVSVFFDAVYGLDRFTHKKQLYGQEWRFYFGVLFDFFD